MKKTNIKSPKIIQQKISATRGKQSSLKVRWKVAVTLSDKDHKKLAHGDFFST